jgi:hypothetical protein
MKCMARRIPRMALIPVRRVCRREVPEMTKTRQPEMRTETELNVRIVKCLHNGESRTPVL